MRIHWKINFPAHFDNDVPKAWDTDSQLISYKQAIDIR